MFQVPPSELDKDKVAAWLSLPGSREDGGPEAERQKGREGDLSTCRGDGGAESLGCCVSLAHNQAVSFVCVCRLVYGVAYEKVTAAIICVVLHIHS